MQQHVFISYCCQVLANNNIMLSASFKSRRSRKLFSDQIHKLINAQNDLQAFHIQTQPAVTAQHV